MSQQHAADRSAPKSKSEAKSGQPDSTELSPQELDKAAGGLSDIHVTKTTDKSSADLFITGV